MRPRAPSITATSPASCRKGAFVAMTTTWWPSTTARGRPGRPSRLRPARHRPRQPVAWTTSMPASRRCQRDPQNLRQLVDGQRARALCEHTLRDAIREAGPVRTEGLIVMRARRNRTSPTARTPPPMFRLHRAEECRCDRRGRGLPRTAPSVRQRQVRNDAAHARARRGRGALRRPRLVERRTLLRRGHRPRR